jgi:hypothetical protein
MAEAELRQPCHSRIYALDRGVDIITHRHCRCLSTDVGTSWLAQEGLVGRLPDVACNGNISPLCSWMEHGLTFSSSSA